VVTARILFVSWMPVEKYMEGKAS